MDQETQKQAIDLRSKVLSAKTQEEEKLATLNWLNFLIKYYKESYDG